MKIYEGICRDTFCNTMKHLSGVIILRNLHDKGIIHSDTCFSIQKKLLKDFNQIPLNSLPTTLKVNDEKLLRARSFISSKTAYLYLSCSRLSRAREDDYLFMLVTEIKFQFEDQALTRKVLALEIQNSLEGICLNSWLLKQVPS